MRAYNGQSSRWYKAAMRQKAGRITAAGMTRDVVFQPANIEVQDAIDASYRGQVQQQSLFEAADRLSSAASYS